MKLKTKNILGILAILATIALMVLASACGEHNRKPYVIISKYINVNDSILYYTYYYKDDRGVLYSFEDTIYYKIGDTIK